MTRLIDADTLVEELHKHFGIGFDDDEWWNSTHVLTAIAWTSTVDAVPVRHGKWIDTEKFKRPWFRHHIFKCSVCKNTLDMDGVNAGRGDANYCPNCGAKMDGEYETD